MVGSRMGGLAVVEGLGMVESRVGWGSSGGGLTISVNFRF